MNTKTNSTAISPHPLPPAEMRDFVLQLISYNQLITDISTGAIQGSVTQLDWIVTVIVELQYATGTITIGHFELSNEEVAHRLLQAKSYDVELLLRDLSRKLSPIQTDQQLVEALYNTIGSLRSYQYRQHKEQIRHKKKS